MAFCTAFVVIGGAIPPIFFQRTLSVLPANLDAITQMPDTAMKNFLMSTLGTAILLLRCVELFGVHVQLIGCLSKYRPRGEEPVQCTEEEVLRYLRLRSQLRRSLGFIAAVISMALLHAGTFRALLNQALPAQPELLPASFLMAYGIYFTGGLACCYLPAHKTLTDVGEVLANQLVRSSLGSRATWKEWSEEQQAVRAYLGLQGSALQDLQQAIAVLTPLLASISALLLGPG
ncbi:hypothetical protein [Archangium lipolyticum]|uniref:hypothetical protein n=1 Tax=Archangium lipolyticum TaxID=2970465 RepID=UPI002149B7BC|nr:hypothetical protein [Archangium lipolyticum]